MAELLEEKELKKLKKADLEKKAKGLGLKVTGTKDELIAAIINNQAKAEEPLKDNGEPGEALVRCVNAFYDKEENVNRHLGTEWTVTLKRAETLIEAGVAVAI